MAITATTGSIDVNSIVESLMQIERAPLTKLGTDLSGIQTKLSAWGKMQSSVSTLRDAARTLVKSDTWRGAKAQSSDEAVVSATGGAVAGTGKYALTVQSLAQSQSVVTGAFAASTTVVGGGTLTIQMGTANAAGSAFTADAARPAVSLTIPAGATLADIRTAINDSDAGISASILDDGSGKRLVLTSRDSGLKQAFEVTVADADGGNADATGLSALAVSATSATGPNGTQRTQSARNAELTVNGLAVSASSNRLDSVIEGVTLDLKKTTTVAVEIDVSTDQEALRASLDAFVKGYNGLATQLAEQTKYDPATKKAGTLQGNSTANTIRLQTRQLVTNQIGSAALKTLSDAGLEVGRDGTLSINETKLKPLLAKPEKLRALLAGDATTAPGIARQLDAKLTAFLDPEGLIKGATDTLDSRRKTVEQQQTRYENRLTEVEARLRRQYSALDKNLSNITGSLAGIQSLLG